MENRSVLQYSRGRISFGRKHIERGYCVEKLTPRQRQGIETKLKITKIATDLFKNKGFSDVTIRDICEEASISVGTFYHHFVSKDEIVNTAYTQIDMLWDERISDYRSKNSEEDILFLFEEAADQVAGIGWELASQSYQQLLSAKNKYTFNPERPIYKKVRKAIESGIQEGTFHADTDVLDLTDTLIRTSRSAIFDWCLREGEPDLRSCMRHDISLILSNFCDCR